MKLRVLDSTLRFRLDRAEVEALGGGQPQEAATHFPGGEVFGYRLVPTSGEIGAVFDRRGITLSIPSDRLLAWAQDEQQVDIQETLSPSDGSLALLIEKDLECLEPRGGEDPSNRFVNPKAI
jgi:hypothetical protein